MKSDIKVRTNYFLERNMNPLTYKDITKNPSRQKLVEFENYLINEDIEGLARWHLENTPWCSKYLIAEFIEEYI